MKTQVQVKRVPTEQRTGALTILYIVPYGMKTSGPYGCGCDTYRASRERANEHMDGKVLIASTAIPGRDQTDQYHR